MKPQSLFIPAFVAFAVGAFAVDPPAVPTTLEALLPMLSVPSSQGSAVEDALQKLAANAARPGAEKERAAFARTLCATASDTKLPFYERSLLLRQLAVLCGAESLEPLAALLTDSDPQIREYAREDLEKNPEPKAVEILRAALKKGGDARWEIGLMNSLGIRRDGAAVALISARVANAETGRAAMASLGKIATPDAIATLEKALPASAQALVEAAGHLAKEGQSAKAASIAAKVYPLNVSTQVHAAALTVLAAADSMQTRSLIPGALDSDSPNIQAAAVSAAFTAYGVDGACKELHPRLANLKPVAKLAFLRLANASAEPDAISLLNDPDPAVQAGAITALGRIGSAASVPALLQIAGTARQDSAPVNAALSVISGPGAVEAIRKASAVAKDPKSRAQAIAILGLRAEKAAAPELVNYAAEADPVISRAACAALKTVGTDAELMPMLKLVLGGKVPNAASAVRAIAARSSARHQCVPNILALGSGAQGKALIPMLDALSLVGGPEALRSVTGYTQASQPEVVEGAVQALCNWPEMDAVAPLLKIGAEAKFPERLRITALRSTEHIILSAVDDSPQSRIDAAMGLLKAAARDEEKNLALSVIASIPNRVSANALLTLVSDEHLKAGACGASLNLANALIAKSDRGSARKLAKAVIAAKPEEPVVKRAQEIVERIVALEKH